MAQHIEAQVQSLLALAEEIKAMVAAQQRSAELDPLFDRLDSLARQNEAIRNDIREVFMMLASQQAAAD